MPEFDASSTTDDVIAGVTLSGKIALVTGASSGLGVETVRVLAGAGAKVVMCARDEQKLGAAMAEVLATEPSASLEKLVVDLADLDSVSAAADAARSAYPEIDLLINNAGVMACPLMRTTQGFEMQFGTNHLGHFLFTCLLVPSLLAGAPARVVNLSSAGHKFANVNLDDPNYQSREYDKWQAYGESKTANVLFSVGLDQRLRGAGVRALAVHPGVIMTNLSRHMEDTDFELLQSRGSSDEKLVFKSVEQGAATSVWAAVAPELAEQGGIYLENCQIAASAVQGMSTGVESYAVDAVAADRLWALSEQMVGQAFSF